MKEQASLWQNEIKSAEFSELCNALYEREITMLTSQNIQSAPALQNRLKSLPYYIKRTAHMMIEADSPLSIDVQNASWSAKQCAKMPINGQELADIHQWYSSFDLKHGLVVPIVNDSYIELDSIDKIDTENQRFRTNAHGWFALKELDNGADIGLLKPNKRVMTAACAGHSWLNNQKTNPHMPTLRELLISCAINWRNFKQPVAV